MLLSIWNASTLAALLSAWGGFKLAQNITVSWTHSELENKQTKRWNVYDIFDLNFVNDRKDEQHHSNILFIILPYHHLYYLVCASPSYTIVHHQLHRHVLPQNVHHDIIHHPTSGASPSTSCSSSNYLTGGSDYLEIYGSPWEARITWKTNDFVRWQCRCRL